MQLSQCREHGPVANVPRRTLSFLLPIRCGFIYPATNSYLKSSGHGKAIEFSPPGHAPFRSSFMDQPPSTVRLPPLIGNVPSRPRTLAFYSVSSSLDREIKNHDNTKKALAECQNQLSHLESKLAVLEKNYTQLSHENQLLRVTLGHLVSEHKRITLHSV